LTYQALLELDGDVRAEILDGELVVSPAPLPKHSNSQGALRRFIGGPFHDDDGHGGPGGWWIFVEVDIQLALHDVVRPDLSGWRRERLPRPGNERPITVVPDWVCEIVSPRGVARDRVKKRRLYAKHGVRHYWIVDPDARTLEALVLEGEHWKEVGAWDEDAVARIAPFAEIELEVGRLFLPRDADPLED
jgi:Uma2 family endonuclease